MEDEDAGGALQGLDACCKVYALHNEPNWQQPWQRKSQNNSSASAFVVRNPASGERALITNTHAVEYASMVKVRARGADERYVATVDAIAPDADLALLSVHDSAFWDETLQPVELAGLPQLQSRILAVGFPIGGESLAITSGVVSRLDVVSYAHGGQQLLALQVDSAINAGASGAPAFDEGGKCRGVAFQSLKGDSVENVGYVIPSSVVQHFLEDVCFRKRSYAYYPVLGAQLQTMESPHLRTSKGMQQGQKGVLVQRIEPTLPVYQYLCKGDVLMSFNGTQIANDASIQFRNGERVHFSVLVSSMFDGDSADVEILRDGARKNLRVPLCRPKRLVPAHLNDQSPQYFVIASLVFTNLSAPYLRAVYGKDFELEGSVRLIDKLLHGMKHHEDEEVVVLSQVLGSNIALGYEGTKQTFLVSILPGVVPDSSLRYKRFFFVLVEMSNLICEEVNGTRIRNVRQLAYTVDTCKDEYLRFDLEDYTQSIVLRTEDAREATNRVLEFHGIPADRSSNLKHADGG